VSFSDTQDRGDGFRLLPGNLAVEMFFMISGFYMSLVLGDKYDPYTWHGRLSFYRSRFLRLWPTFALTTLLVYAWWAISWAYLGRTPTSAGHFHELLPPLGSAALALTNIFMVGQDIPSLFHVNDAGAHLTFGPAESLADGSLWLGSARNIGPAWSIGTEIWFYLLAPFLVRLPTAGLLTLIAGSAVLRYGMAELGRVTYFFFPAQLGLFLVGVLTQRFGGGRSPLGVGCMAIVASGCLLFSPYVGLDESFKWFLYTGFALSMPALFLMSRNSAVDRLVGELSYPVYITHMIVLSIAGAVGKKAGIEIGGLTLFLLTLPLSLILVLWVEAPIARYRTATTPRPAGDPKTVVWPKARQAQSPHCGKTSTLS